MLLWTNAYFCPMQELQSDQELWHAFKEGNREAFGQMFTIYYPLLHHYGLKLSQNAGLVEDVLQEFFLYLHDHRENLSDLDAIRPYLFTSFRRRLLRQVKTQSVNRRLALEENLSMDLQFSAEEIIVAQEEHAQMHSLLLNSLNELPQRQKEVVYLRYYNEMSLADIASVMGISYHGVANTLHKAFKVLRKNFDKFKAKNLSIIILASISKWI